MFDPVLHFVITWRHSLKPAQNTICPMKINQIKICFFGRRGWVEARKGDGMSKNISACCNFLWSLSTKDDFQSVCWGMLDLSIGYLCCLDNPEFLFCWHLLSLLSYARRYFAMKQKCLLLAKSLPAIGEKSTANWLICRLYKSRGFGDEGCNGISVYYIGWGWKES